MSILLRVFLAFTMITGLQLNNIAAWEMKFHMEKKEMGDKFFLSFFITFL